MSSFDLYIKLICPRCSTIEHIKFPGPILGNCYACGLGYELIVGSGVDSWLLPQWDDFTEILTPTQKTFVRGLSDKE